MRVRTLLAAAEPRRWLAAALLLGALSPAAQAEEHVTVDKQDWSFSGVFGQYDQAQLQRGLKIYRESCSACHSIEFLPFRALAEETGPNLSQEAVQQIASEYTVDDISTETGEPIERPAKPTDRFPSPFPNPIAAAQANGGAYPPDLSVIAKARAVPRGFPGFLVDIFANYAENGPDYIYALLTGYEEPPEEVEPVPSKWYNPVFRSGDWTAMPPPLSDGRIEYTDGTPETLEQYAADISAFLMWAAEPTLETRKRLGFRVMIFLAVFAVLLYFTKRKIWRNVEH